VTFETLELISFYTVGQGLFSLILIHGFPKVIG
jgi:hypothetical protein